MGTIVHVSCRDRNRLALQSQVVGSAALGAEAVLCMQGDPVPGIEHVADMTATQLIASASAWSALHPLAVGAVVNPFAEDVDRELRLLRRKIAAGATFVQSQMIFDLRRLEAFLSAAEDILAGVRFYASVALLRSERMAERAYALPGVAIPQRAVAQIGRGGGIDLARELAAGLASISRVDALHVFPLGAEAATREVAAEFRVARGVSAQRPADPSVSGTATGTTNGDGLWPTESRKQMGFGTCDAPPQVVGALRSRPAGDTRSTSIEGSP